MKRINILLAVLIVVVGCKMGQKEKEIDIAKANKEQYLSFGGEISDAVAKDKYQMLGLYQNLEAEDTVQVKFQAQVTEVCQNKGCWMKVELANGHETMVRFKDYGFFVPKDIAGSIVTVEGNAFLETMSLEEQQHLAEDAGKKLDSTEISRDMVSYGFEAAGVLVQQ